jgi:hypothetical protein
LKFKMRFEIGRRNARNPAAKNFRHDDGGIPGTIHAKIGKLVRNDALRVERPEAGFIAKQRAACHGHAAGQQNLDGRIQPNHGNARIAEKFGGACLRVGAAPKSEHSGLLLFHGAAERGAQFISFQLAKRGLAVTFEKLRDGNPRGGFNAFVEIHEAPAELAGQSRADGAFAGAHKPGQADDRNAQKRTARCKRLVHDSNEREADFITLDKGYSDGPRS